MILRKLVQDKHDRMIYASLVIIAANSGGAFSPIGERNYDYVVECRYDNCRWCTQ